MVGDCRFELLDARDVLIDDRLVDQRPQCFCRLQLECVGPQLNEANAIGDFQFGWAMPSGILEDQQNDAADAGFGLAREGFERHLEEWLRHAVGRAVIPPGSECSLYY